jgi:peptidoglycan/LPS O-acetylase OafA/YrhL
MPRHIPILDGLRAASILLVLACHMLPLGPKAWQLNEAAGLMGMSLFFALSGFLIASFLLPSQDVADFYRKRLARIVPLAYLYIAVVFLFFMPTSDWLPPTALFVLNYDLPQITRYTGHLWSLCVEMQFYAAIGISVLLFGRTGILLVWPACVIVTALRIYVGAEISIVTHIRVDEILAGACVATLFANNLKLTPRTAMAGFLACALLWFLTSLPAAGPFLYARPYASAGLLGCALFLPRCPIRLALEGRHAKYIATISYALYVIHPLTLQGWMNDGSTFDRYALKRPISFVLTFAAAHLSTFYWERPWIRWAGQIKQAGSRVPTDHRLMPDQDRA